MPFSFISAILDSLTDPYKAETLAYQREVACFAWGDRGIVSLTTDDSPGVVNFDFFSIWKEFKKDRPEEVVMIHTHPPGNSRMSSIDKNMVHGWRVALGVPIWYIIMTNVATRYYLCVESDKKTAQLDQGLFSVRNMPPYNQMLWHTLYGLSKSDKIAEITAEGRVSSSNSMIGVMDTLNEVDFDFELPKTNWSWVGAKAE